MAIGKKIVWKEGENTEDAGSEYYYQPANFINDYYLVGIGDSKMWVDVEDFPANCGIALLTGLHFTGRNEHKLLLYKKLWEIIKKNPFDNSCKVIATDRVPYKGQESSLYEFCMINNFYRGTIRYNRNSGNKIRAFEADI